MLHKYPNNTRRVSAPIPQAVFMFHYALDHIGLRKSANRTTGVKCVDRLYRYCRYCVFVKIENARNSVSRA